MSDNQLVLKKLQIKDQSKPVLVLNAPAEYHETISAFDAIVHTEIKEESYTFVQVFGTSNDQIRDFAIKGKEVLGPDGLLWLCYPKKSSKKYKGLDCSRESVAVLLAQEGFEPVRQVAIDDDWSALRFRLVEKIKKMTRKSAVTEVGKQRIQG